jgi:hypothetical protein
MIASGFILQLISLASLALPHSFSFGVSEQTFRQVLERDPTCAIATWGIATAVIGNTFDEGPTTPARAQQAKTIRSGDIQCDSRGRQR